MCTPSERSLMSIADRLRSQEATEAAVEPAAFAEAV
jgi:hypothetical protein